MHRFQRPSSIGINELEETIDSLIVLVHSRITKKEVFILLVYFSWLARKETGVQARWCTNKSWTQRGTSKYVPLFLCRAISLHHPLFFSEQGWHTY